MAKLTPAEKAARTRARNALARERAALERFNRWRSERIHWERERDRLQALPPSMRVGVKLRPPPPPLGVGQAPPPVVAPEPSYQPPGGPPGSSPVPLQGSPIQGEGDTLTLAVLLWWQDWTRTTLAAMGKAPVVSIQAPDGQVLQVPEDIAKQGPGAVLAWLKTELGDRARVNGPWVATTTGTQKKASPPKRGAVAAPATELDLAAQAGAEEARQEELETGALQPGPRSQAHGDRYARRVAAMERAARQERQTEGPLPGQPDNDDEGAEDDEDED